MIWKFTSKRLISLALVVCLIPSGQTTAHAQPLETAPNLQAVQPLPLDLKNLKVPSDNGRVEKVFQGSSETVVFLIQDAHAIPEAQENIRRLLAHFQNTYGTSLTALEGVVTHLDPQMFRSYPDKESLIAVLDGFNAKGELAGASAAAIRNGGNASYEGLEDRAVYDAGLAYFLAAKAAGKNLEPVLLKMDGELQRKKEQIYSADLLRVDRALLDFRENRLSLLEVLQTLKAFREPEAGTQVALVAGHAGAANIEQSGQSAKLRGFALKVQRMFEVESASAEGKARLKNFHEHNQLFQTSQISPQAFALVLHELTEGTSLEGTLPEEFHAGLWNEKRLKQLEGSLFFREFQAYAAAVKEQLFRSDEERLLDREGLRLELVRKLMNLELGYEEWETVRSAREPILAGFDGEALRAQMAFYANAQTRDEIMMRNLQKLLDQRRPASAAVVAGGFHTDGLTKRLREKGISFAVLSPEISKVPETAFYEKQMAGDVSWKSYFRFEKGEINLYDAFLRGARDQLLNTVENQPGASPDARGMLLKRWRDQILRDLASSGRIEEAGEYTRFLDEIGNFRNAQQTAGLERVERFIEDLKRLEQGGALNPQSVARLLRPSARPVDAIQGALERSARLGGPLIDVRVFSGGISVQPSVLSLQGVTPDSGSEKALSRSELRSESDFLSDFLPPGYKSLVTLRDSFYSNLKLSHTGIAAEASKEDSLSRQAMAWILRGGLPAGEDAATIQALVLSADDFRALGIAYPALGVYASDVVGHLSHHAKLGSQDALYALADIVLSKPEALDTDEKDRLIDALIVLANDKQLEAVQFLGRLFQGSPTVLSPLTAIKIGSQFPALSETLGKSFTLSIYNADSDAVRSAIFKIAAHEDGTELLLRDIARLHRRLVNEKPDLAKEIANVLIQQASSNVSLPHQKQALLGLAEVFASLTSAQRMEVAALFTVQSSSTDQGILWNARLAAVMSLAYKGNAMQDPVPAFLSDSKPAAESSKKQKEVFVEAFQTKYKNQIIALAANEDLLAIQALGHYYKSAGAEERTEILYFLKDSLGKTADVANAGVRAIGILFDELESFERNELFSLIKSKDWQSHFQTDAVLGLMQIAKIYNEKPEDAERFEAVLSLAAQPTVSNFPASVLVYLGTEAALSGDSDKVNQVYNQLMQSEAPEALLGLAELYSALEDPVWKRAIFDKLRIAFLQDNSYAALGLGLVADDLGFSFEEDETFKEIADLLLAPNENLQDEIILALGRIYWRFPFASPSVGIVISLINEKAKESDSFGLLAAAMIELDIREELQELEAPSPELSKVSSGELSDQTQLPEDGPSSQEILEILSVMAGQPEPDVPLGMIDYWNRALAGSFDLLSPEQQTAFLKSLKAKGEPPGAAFKLDLAAMLNVFKGAGTDSNPYLVSMAMAYGAAQNAEHRELVKNFPAVILKAAAKGVPLALTALGHLIGFLDAGSVQQNEAVRLLLKGASVPKGTKKLSALQLERVTAAVWALALSSDSVNMVKRGQIKEAVEKAMIRLPDQQEWLQAVMTLDTMGGKGASVDTPQGHAAYEALVKRIEAGSLIWRPALGLALRKGLAGSKDEALNSRVKKALLQWSAEGLEPPALQLTASIYPFLSPAEKTDFLASLKNHAGGVLEPAAFMALSQIAEGAAVKLQYVGLQETGTLMQNAEASNASIAEAVAEIEKKLDALTAPVLPEGLILKLLSIAGQNAQPDAAAATAALGKLANRIPQNLLSAVFKTLKLKLDQNHDAKDRLAAVSTLTSLYFLFVPNMQKLTEHYLAEFLKPESKGSYMEGAYAAALLAQTSSKWKLESNAFAQRVMTELKKENPQPGAYEAAVFLALSPGLLDVDLVMEEQGKVSPEEALLGLSLTLMAGKITDPSEHEALVQKAIAATSPMIANETSVRALIFIFSSYGAVFGINKELFNKAAWVMTVISSSFPEVLPELARKYHELEASAQAALLKAVASQLDVSSPYALEAAAYLKILKTTPVAKASFSSPNDTGLDLESLAKSFVYTAVGDFRDAVEEALQPVNSSNKVILEALHWARSYALKSLSMEQRLDWMEKLEGEFGTGFTGSEISLEQGLLYAGMTAASADQHPDVKEAFINKLLNYGGEFSAYEGLGYVLASMPAPLPGQPLPAYMSQRAQILALLKEQFEMDAPGTALALARALPALSEEERASVIEGLYEHADIYSDVQVKALLYQYVKEPSLNSFLLEGLTVAVVKSEPAAIKNIGYALKAISEADGFAYAQVLQALGAAFKSGSVEAAESLAHVYPYLPDSVKAGFHEGVQNLPLESRLKVFAILTVYATEAAGTDALFSEGFQLPPALIEEPGQDPWPAFQAFQAPVGSPWVNPAVPGREISSKYYEYDPRSQVFYETGYSLPKPASIGKSNEAARKLMMDFESFEDLNAEVISLLMQQDKTVEDMRLLFSVMEKMVKAYLVLFKKQKPEMSIDAISKSSEDLAGGRAIAKLFLSVREEAEKALQVLQPAAKDSDRIDPVLNSMLQGLDASVSGHLIITPAETTEAREPSRIKGVTYAEYRQYLQRVQSGVDESAARQVITGTSFHELINIIHQKGVRNLSTLFPTDGSAAQGLVRIDQAGPGGALAPALSVPFSYLDARLAPDQDHPLPVRLAAAALAKGQLIHQSEQLFPVKSAVILSTETRALINLPLGLHSARIQLSLGPVQENGRLFINYTDNNSPAYAPGNNIRFDALVNAFTAAGFKVRKVGATLDASFDKDSGASSLADIIEKLEMAVQVLTSTKDLDLRINETAIMKSNPEQAVEVISERFIKDGFLVRGSVHELMLQFPYPDLSQWENMAKKFGILEQGAGQRFLDRISRRFQRAADRGEAMFSSAATFDLSSKYQEESRRSPVEALLQNLFTQGETLLPLSLDARQIAALALMIRPFAEHRVLAAAGRYTVERIVIPLLYEDLTIDVIKDNERSVYFGGAAYLGRFYSTQTTYDRLRDVKLPDNRLNAQALLTILKTQGFGQTSAGRKLLKTRDVEISEGQTLLDAAISSEESIKRVTQADGDFDFEGFFEKAGLRHSVSPVSIGGMAVQQGKVLAVARFKGTGRAPADFRDALWIGESADNKDDPHLVASSGIVMTTGGVQSHGSVRAGEHRKPGSIFNTARITSEGMSFEAYSGYAEETEIQFSGRTLTYSELKAGSKKTYTVREGDLVYLDAREGVLYVIAEAGENNGRTLADYRTFLEWKRVSGYEASRLQQDDAAAIAIDLVPLQDLFRSVESESLFRAILDELLDSNLLSPDSLNALMSSLSDRKDLQLIVKDFLRGRAADEIDHFEQTLQELLLRLKSPVTQSSAGLDAVYLDVERFMSRTDSLQGMIALANGTWQGRVSAKDIESAQKTLIDSAVKRVGLYLKALLYGLRDFLEKAALNPAYELSMLIAYRSQITRAAAVASPEEIIKRLGVGGDVQALDRRIEQKRAERMAEVEAQRGLGILWKSSLKDRFSRPLAGGKGSNSAETLHAIEFLRAQKMLPAGFEVVAPEGFSIQPAEYQRWLETKGDLTDDLKQSLVSGYRDLVIKQIDALLAHLESDQRTSPAFAQHLRTKLLNPLRASLGSAQDAVVIDGLISLARSFSQTLLAAQPEGTVSKSLHNRLEVLGAFAVRSSGLKEDSEEAAWAGMKETKLARVSTREFFEAVVDVWESESESILNDEMINGKVSGTAFSADTASRDLSVVRIEASHGLAKGLVDQRVKDPDFYRVKKPEGTGQPYRVVSSHIGEKVEKVVLDFETEMGYAEVLNSEEDRRKPALTEAQTLAIAQLVDGFSIYFGYPVDVEFSLDSDNRIIPLQVRPITSLREAIRKGQVYLRSELRNGENEDAYRFIAKPSDFGKAPGFSKKSYAKSVSKAGIDFHFKKTRAYRFEDMGRFRVSALTFRLVRFPESLRAKPEDSSAAGALVGAASPKYSLEVFLANEEGEGTWRKLEDVEIIDGQPLFIYRTTTQHITQPGLFDLFLNKSEQNGFAAQLEEFGKIQESTSVIALSWKDENGLFRNYYLPNMLSPEHPETIGDVTRVSRSAADDPGAAERITIDLDAVVKEKASDSPKGWLRHLLNDYVRPGHLMLLTDVQEGQDFVILQNLGSTNGFTVEEKLAPAPRKQAAAPRDFGEQSAVDDQWGAESMSRVPQEHSLVLQARNFVEGDEGKLQFFYDGPFRIDYGSKQPLQFEVTNGKLYAGPAGASDAAVDGNVLVTRQGDKEFEVRYANGRITVTNHTADEAAQIWVLKGPSLEPDARSELRSRPPALPDPEETGLVPAIPEAPKKSGLLARIGSVIQRRTDRLKFNSALKQMKKNPEAIYPHWFNEQNKRGPEYMISLIEALLDPALYPTLDRRSRQQLAYYLLSSALPDGYESYIRERLGRLAPEDVASAFLVNSGAEEIVPNLLRYNTADGNELIRKLLKHPETSVRHHVFQHLILGATAHLGSASELLREARFLGEGLSVSEVLDKFSAEEDQGFYAYVPQPTVVDLRRIAELPFEVNLFSSQADRLVILKGGEASVSAMFPGKSTVSTNVHNHPTGNIFPSGYQRRAHGFGSEDYTGDLMAVGTTGFHLIATTHGLLRFYRDVTDAKGKPGEIKVRFSDKTEIDFKADLVGEGPNQRYFFNEKSPLLLDPGGRVRDFRAAGLLGPSGQVFALQFISWRSLAGSFLAGDKQEAFERFMPASLFNSSKLSAGQALDFESYFKDIIRIDDAARARLADIERGIAEDTRAGHAGDISLKTAETSATSELVPYRASGFETGIGSSLGNALPSLDQIEIRLQVLLATDYEAGISFADRYLAFTQPPEVKQAVFKGLANGAEFLEPVDTNIFLNLGLKDSDSRVNAAAVDLLGKAKKEADVFGALQMAFSRHIQTTRLVRMTGRLNLSHEQKRVLFLLYTQSSAIYRNFLSESFSRDLFGYAPQDLFFSLMNAELPSAMNEEIISAAYQNLTAFEMGGLEGVSGTGHLPLIPRLDLEDPELERLAAMLNVLGRPRSAQLYLNQMKKPVMILTAGSGTDAMQAEDQRPALIQELESLNVEERKKRLLSWAPIWRKEYGQLTKKDYAGSYRYEQDLSSVLLGLSRWELGQEFNRDLLSLLISNIPKPRETSSFIVTDFGALLGAIPLANEDSYGFYQTLIAQGMEFFNGVIRRGIPVVIRSIGSSRYLTPQQKRELFRAAFSDPEMASDRWLGHLVENEQRRPLYQRERNLEWALEALLDAKLTTAEDMELIELIPMFRQDKRNEVLRAMSNLGIEADSNFNFMESLKARHPEYMPHFKDYMAKKIGHVLHDQKGLAESDRETVRPNVNDPPPALPEGRSELRIELPEVARELAEALVRDGLKPGQTGLLAVKVADAVRQAGVDGLASQLRIEAVFSAFQVKEAGSRELPPRMDRALASFSVQWFLDALSEELEEEKLGAAFDLPGQEIVLGRVLQENPRLKERFETLLISKRMDPSLLKTRGIPIEILSSPSGYRARFSLSNGESMPVFSSPESAAELQNNRDAFAVTLTGVPENDDAFELTALTAALAGALLTSSFSATAEKLKKSPVERAEILRRVWAALLKTGLYDGPSFLEMGEDGVLSVDRGNLQRFITEFLARKAVEASA